MKYFEESAIVILIAVEFGLELIIMLTIIITIKQAIFITFKQAIIITIKQAIITIKVC
jgi:hypothetical protein